MRRLGLVVTAALAVACGDDGGGGSGAQGSTAAAADSGSTAAAASTGVVDSSTGASTGWLDVGSGGGDGEFSVLTYNVAGLPEGFSSSNPEQNIPQISPLLNAFDMVLAQEDFWYHDELSADVTLPYASEPYSEMPTLADIGDGLNRFGVHPFTDHERVPWYACNGSTDCASDCLATKGWSFARTEIAPGVEIDVYNLHMEAGGCPEDIEIRLNSAQDLAEAIATRSADRALIVAGDFNLRATDPEDVEPLALIIDGAGLTDACAAVDCGDERIDKIMVRNGSFLEVEVLTWWVPPEFVDADTGAPLSDHLPVAAELRFSQILKSGAGADHVGSGRRW